MRRGLRITALAALVLGVGATPAAALDQGVGQLAPFGADPCSPNVDHAVNPAVASGSFYQVLNQGGDVDWTVTSWSTQANATPGRLTMKIFRPIGGTIYEVVAHDGPQTLTPNSLNTFSTNLPGVRPGDVVGLHNLDNNIGCTYSSGPSEQELHYTGDLSNGQSGPFSTTPGTLVNVKATLTPTNTATLGAPTLDKKKGTATIPFNAPNPGSLTASGTGVKVYINGLLEFAAFDRAAHKSAGVTPGVATVVLAASGKKKKKLRSKGKVKVSTTLTYTPALGAPKSYPLSVTLKIKKKK
jgi:hypothetical protein